MRGDHVEATARRASSVSAVRQPPLSRQCRGWITGQKVLGATWSPPRRCGNDAGANGYCRRHQPTTPTVSRSGRRPADALGVEPRGLIGPRNNKPGA